MKSAFLIMAHSNFDMLKLLVTQLDYKDNDIYIHIDKKCGNVDYGQFETLTKYSKVYCLRDRMKVTWGSCSQIKLELKMFDAAFNNSGGQRYDYFHLISGVDFPLMKNQDMSQFLEENDGAEYIGMVNAKNVIEQRLGCWHFYTDRNLWGKLYRHIVIPLQKVLKIHHIRDFTNYRLGPNWCTVSSSLVGSLLKEKDDIVKRYRYSFCCDEVFLQTFVFEHKEFLQKIYCPHDQYKSCMRYIDFKRGRPYTFHVDDISELLQADRFFARKVDKATMLGLKKHLNDS